METKTCPGCHFGCAIEKYQCGRGEKLCAQWRQTGKLPERRQPGRGGADHGNIPIDERLMHLLHIAGIALHDLADESGSSADERRVLDCLMRQGRSASLKVIEGRTGISDVGPLVEQGLVEERPGSQGTTFYTPTDLGLDQARRGETQRRQAEAEFLSPLDGKEREQLAALIMKVLEPGFKRRAARAGSHEHIGS